MEISEVFEKKLLVENDVVRLKYGPHSLQRLLERSKGSLFIIPRYIQIIPKNVIWFKKVGYKTRFLFEITYSKWESLYIVVQDKKYVITLWFDKCNKYGKNKRFQEQENITEGNPTESNYK